MTMYRHLNTRFSTIIRYFKLGISLRNMSDNLARTTSTLPDYFKVGNFNLKADQFRDEHYRDVFKMVQDAMKDSAGVGEGAFETVEQFEHYLKPSVLKLTYHDCDADDRIVAFFMFYPSPLSRSFRPVNLAGYSFLHKDYRGKGLLDPLFRHSDNWRMKLGYSSILARLALTSRSTVPTLKFGSQHLGFIPKSLKVPNFGWMVDIISYTDRAFKLTEDQVDLFVKRNRDVPILPENESGNTSMCPADDMINQSTFTAKDGEILTLKGATRKDVQVVEQMVRHCAQSGEGFGLDEFCPDNGHFIHKLIHQPKVVLATDSFGDIKGAAICGFSTLSRVTDSLCSAYFIVKKSERRKGVATALLEKVTQLSLKENCDVMLFDIYINNSVGIAWLIKNGFVTCGSLPHCGYIANNGYTDALTMNKELNKLSTSDMISKL